MQLNQILVFFYEKFRNYKIGSTFECLKVLKKEKQNKSQFKETKINNAMLKKGKLNLKGILNFFFFFLNIILYFIIL